MIGSLEFKGVSLDEVQSSPFVGVNIDNTLSWKQHIAEVKKKISRMTGVFYKLRHTVPEYVLVLMYNAFVLPHITYCLEVWGNTCPTYLNEIFLIQKRIVRTITDSHWCAHSGPLFKRLNILDIFKQHKIQLVVIIHDVLQLRLPDTFQDFFTPIKHSFTTQQSARNDLTIPKANHRTGQFTVKYSGAKLWNCVPYNIRNINSRSNFQTEFQNYLQSL